MKTKSPIEELQNEFLKLKESESVFKSTLENLPMAVVIHAADASIIFSNHEAQNILGLTKEQMQGKTAKDTAWKFTHEDGKTMNVEDYPVSKVISTKEPLKGYIIGIIQPNRSYITWVNVEASPVFNEKGDIDKIIIYFIDITEKKAYEDKLLKQNEELIKAKEKAEENQKRLILACRSGGIGIWELDVVNNILHWDKQMFQLYGTEANKFLGTYEVWYAAVHPEDLQQAETELQSALNGVKEFNMESKKCS